MDGVSKAWRGDRPGGTPPRLVAPLTRALDALDRAVTRGRSRKAQSTALDVAQATLDLRLRYRPPGEIDRARFALRARQAHIDASARQRSALSGDVATLTWIRDRIAHSLDSVDLVRIDHRLTELEAKVADDELRAAARTITALLHAATRARPA